MNNKRDIEHLISQILHSNTTNKSELVGYLRDFAYAKCLDMDTILYIINSLYPILEMKLDLNVPDNDGLQDGILDLYSIFSLEQGYYADYIYEKIVSLDKAHLPYSCFAFIDGIIECC